MLKKQFKKKKTQTLVITPIVLEPVDTFMSVFHNIKYQTLEPSVFNISTKTKFQKN